MRRGNTILGRAALCLPLLVVTAVCSSNASPRDETPAPEASQTQTQALQRPVPTRDSFLNDEALHDLEISLSETSIAGLAKNPRKYVDGTFQYAGVTYPVSVKLKGHRSFRPLSGKPAFKLRFDKKNPKGRFLGLKRLTLNNMVDDPTRMRETIGYHFFRAAGVAAPRTAYATVKLNGENYGIYLIVEAIDDVFLAAHFSKPIGGLYEAEYGCDLYPHDIPKFERDQGPKKSREMLLKLALAAAQDDSNLLTTNSPYLDSKSVIRFLAASTLLGDFDGYWHSHNYYLYQQDPKGGWLLLPWGIDRTFERHLNIRGSTGRLAELCFADKRCNLAYSRRLYELSELMERQDLSAVMRHISAKLRKVSHLNYDPRDQIKQETRQRKRLRMRTFIRDTPKKIREQLNCLEYPQEVDPDHDGYGCMDCDANNPKVHPGATEICDGIDNDCNGLVDDAPQCPCQILQVGENTFHLCNWQLGWQGAQNFCEARGLGLAKIDNAKQSAALFSATQKITYGRWWFGATDRQREGSWIWADGSAMKWSNWRRGQPNNLSCGEDCSSIEPKALGKWTDAHCQLRQPFICR